MKITLTVEQGDMKFNLDITEETLAKATKTSIIKEDKVFNNTLKTHNHTWITYEQDIIGSYVGDGTGKIPSKLKPINMICTECGDVKPIN